MSIVVAVKKGGKIVIASDSQCLIHDILAINRDMGEPTPKIVQIGDAYIGGTGWMAVMGFLEDIASRPCATGELSFSSRLEVQRSMHELHRLFKEDYGMFPHGDQEHEPAESSRNNFLVVSEHGIFAVAPYRSVEQLDYFWAIGSGHMAALGCLEGLYWRDDLDAWDLATKAVLTACKYDPNCSLPFCAFQVQEWRPPAVAEVAQSIAR